MKILSEKGFGNISDLIFECSEIKFVLLFELKVGGLILKGPVPLGILA